MNERPPAMHALLSPRQELGWPGVLGCRQQAGGAGSFAGGLALPQLFPSFSAIRSFTVACVAQQWGAATVALTRRAYHKPPPANCAPMLGQRASLGPCSTSGRAILAAGPTWRPRRARMQPQPVRSIASPKRLEELAPPEIDHDEEAAFCGSQGDSAGLPLFGRHCQLLPPAAASGAPSAAAPPQPWPMPRLHRQAT